MRSTTHSKGKIERWSGTLREAWPDHLDIDSVDGIEALNRRLWAYVEGSSTHTSPTACAAGSELPLFEPRAVEALFQASRGLPRQINRIAHYALSAAAIAKAPAVDAEHMQRAVDELRT